MNVAETVVRKNAHDFTICVTDKGTVTYSLDGGEERHAKLKDRKLYFIGVQEVIVRGELQELRDMELPDGDFAILQDAQDRVLAAIAEEKTMERLGREDKSTILKRVDRWKKRVRLYKRDKKRYVYAVHDFTIGAQSYRFYERRMDKPVSWDGIIINPAYKVSRSLSGTGAVPVQKGELTFWYYHDEEQGWFNVRELTLNELICTEIIHSYGMVREGKI